MLQKQMYVVDGILYVSNSSRFLLYHLVFSICFHLWSLFSIHESMIQF